MKRILIVLLLFAASVSHASFVNISAQNGESFNAVIVEKEKKKLHVVKVNGNGVTVLKSVSVLTGKAGGDKQITGDLKTPEGVYKVLGFLPNSKLKEMYGDASKLYGYGAYPLNYPNLLDSLYGKTGGGIWLHGKEENRQDPATKGCVAFDNDDVKAVGAYLSKGTPVLITGKAMEGSQDKYHKMFHKAQSAVMDYLAAWQNNNFEKFRAAYSKNFRVKNGQGLNAYLNYKKSLMDSFPNRRIAADKFRVFYETEDEAVVEFDQYYSADNITAYGRKTLYLRNEGGVMRIIAEDFAQTKPWAITPDMDVAKAEIVRPEETEPAKPVSKKEQAAVAVVTKTKPEKAKADKQVKPETVKPETVKPEKVEPETAKPGKEKTAETKPEEIILEDNLADIRNLVTGFIGEWKDAWEARDIERFMALYADKFVSGNMNKQSWRADKSAKFARLSSVRVDISEINITALSPERFEAVFRQKYTGDTYSDTGIKTLRLEYINGSMTIVSEQWRAK